MTSLLAFTVLVALVALERVAELVVSTRNAAWSKERGGIESGLGHYPFMVVLHTGLLVGALAEAWLRRPDVPSVLAWSMLALVVASQALRWWCITTLGRRWNTRVIVVPGMAPVRSGPYRLFRHPNYVAVVVEALVRRPDVPPGLAWSMLAVVVASQALRWWCIATLGRRWNTRVIVVPDLPPVTHGPYRFLSHPNYVAVVAEGLALPLVHGLWMTAVGFTVLNAVVLSVRLRVENAALAGLPAPGPTSRADAHA
jgi:methyltransferase